MNNKLWFNIPPRRPRGLAPGETETVTSNLPLFEGMRLKFGRTKSQKVRWKIWFELPNGDLVTLFFAKTRGYFSGGKAENRDAHVYQMLNARKIKHSCPKEIHHLLSDNIIAFAAMADLEGIPETIKTTFQYKKHKVINT
jgi:hypothetical protein